MRREAAERSDEAAREVELSRWRLDETRRKVVEPLRAAGDRNQFADLIRTSLINGHRRRTT
jgi:hypothetical protein